MIRLTRNQDQQQQMSLHTASFLAGLAGFVPLIDVGYAIRRFCRLPLDRARKLGLEVLIGKRCGSRYEAGRRNGAWIKVKLRQEQEFVIGGTQRRISKVFWRASGRLLRRQEPQIRRQDRDRL